MQTYLKTRPVWIQLLLFLGISFGLFMIVLVIGSNVLTRATGINALQGLDKLDPKNPNSLVYIRWMLLIQFLSLFVIPSLLFAYFSDPRPASYLQLQAPHKNIFWLLGIATILVAIPATEYIGYLNQHIPFGSSQTMVKDMEEKAARQIQFMLSDHRPVQLVLNLIFIALFAGIGEELFFRGILQRMMIRAFKNPWAGIVVTAVIFSAFHFQFFGFLPRLLLGIILGVIYWYSGSLWVAILTHFFYDGLFLIVAYVFPKQALDTNENLMDPVKLLPMALISLVLAIVLIWQMKKQSVVRYADVYRDDAPPADRFNF